MLYRVFLQWYNVADLSDFRANINENFGCDNILKNKIVRIYIKTIRNLKEWI